MKKNIFYIFLGAILFFFFLGIFLFLPVLTLPELSLRDQIFTLQARDYLMIITLSLLISLNLILIVYRKKELKMKILPSLSFSGTGGILGIFSGILASSFCLSCVALILGPIFAFLGLGTSALIFTFKYKFYIFLISTFLLGFSLFFNLRALKKNKCENC